MRSTENGDVSDHVLGLFGKALKEEGVHGLGFMAFGLVM
jgi:hypothetical protein